MSIIRVKPLTEKIDTLSESSFSLLTTLKESKHIFQQLKKQDLLVYGEFDDNLWRLANPNSKGRTYKIDFNELCLNLFDNTPNLQHLKSIIKCWLLELSNTLKPSTVVFHYYHFLIAFRETKGFQQKNIDKFIDWLHKPHIKTNIKITLITTVLNFLDYSDLEVGNVLIPKLYEINSKLTFTRNVRRLPPSGDILKFSYYLEKHFETLEQLDTLIESDIKKEKLLYYPLLIWWKLTTIIPIRSAEFAAIKRDCLLVKKNNFFIKLPRRKIQSKNKKNIQILDEISIPKEIFDFINAYINETEPYGHSKTLISYPSLIWTDPSNRRERQKRVITDFNRENLQSLLTKFYQDVLHKQYNCIIPRENHLSPNDTRHLAFISLMMQGISPIEIARLGGHQTIHAQYHYSYHIEYWIDNEVVKLTTKFKHMKEMHTNDNASKNISDSFIPKDVQLKAFAPPTSSFHGTLSIGYCTDSLQRCESEECMLCSHWRIDAQELLKKEDLIKECFSKRRRHIHELFAFIKNLHTHILKDEFTRTNPNTLKQLKTTSKQIQAEIYNLTKIQTLCIKGDFSNE